MKSEYDILGVSPDATDAEIKKAYRNLAMTHHPDRGGDAETFKRVSQAYDRITKARKKVDSIDIQWTPKSKSYQWRGFGDYSNDAKFNKPTIVVVDLSLESTLYDQVKIISLRNNDKIHSIQIDIPAGIKDNDNIIYRNVIPQKSSNSPKCDLKVIFRVMKDPKFDIDNKDKASIITDITIDCFQAISGGKIPITGIDKKKLIVNIPPGTQPNTVFNLKEQGLYRRGTSSRGDLKLIVKIKIPAIDTLPNEIQNFITTLTKKGK